MKATFLKLARSLHQRRAFTLIEVLFAAAIGIVVLMAAASLLVLTARTNFKSTHVNESSVAARYVQDHLRMHLSRAVADTKQTPMLIPTYAIPDPTDTTAPIRYAMVTYRVSVANGCNTSTAYAAAARTLTLNCPVGVVPQAGDFLFMDGESTGTGIKIQSIDSTTDHTTYQTIVLTLASPGLAVAVAANTLATIQRSECYATVPTAAVVAGLEPTTASITAARLLPAGSTMSLVWFSSPTAAAVTVNNNVDSTQSYIFTQEAIPSTVLLVPPEGITQAVGIGWSFNYMIAADEKRSGVANMGTNPTFYEQTAVSGIFMPKSGGGQSGSPEIELPHEPTLKTTKKKTTPPGTTKRTSKLRTD